MFQTWSHWDATSTSLPSVGHSVKFIQARWYHAGGNTPITRIVIHDMEMPEKPDAAEVCAAYFARGERQASAHYCVDNNSAVQCVRDTDIAFHAPPNTGSIGIEHAGYARQQSSDWLDAYGTAMLRDVSAPLVRDLCARHGIPRVWLSVGDLKQGRKGITSHNNVSLAFGKSTHTDPGPGFPIDQFMQWVIGPPPVPPAPDPQEDDVPFVYATDPTKDASQVLDTGSKLIIIKHGSSADALAKAGVKTVTLDPGDFADIKAQASNKD